MGNNDVLPPHLVSLCVGKIEGPLQLLIDLKSLRKLTLAQLPHVDQLPANANGSSNSGRFTWAAMEQVQECLPDVGIKVTGRYGVFACHCCSQVGN